MGFGFLTRDWSLALGAGSVGPLDHQGSPQRNKAKQLVLIAKVVNDVLCEIRAGG